MLFSSIAGMIVYFIFYGNYFAKQIRLKQQNIATNRLGRGDKPATTRRLEYLLTIATYGTAIAQFCSVPLGKNMPFSVAAPAILRWMGVLLALLGTVLFVLSMRQMSTNWRAGVDASQKTTLVTSGIYTYSRNPAFVGFDLLYIGSVLVTPNIILFALTLGTIGLLHQQIKQEEAFMLTQFGDAYRTYQKNTKRYFLLF